MRARITDTATTTDTEADVAIIRLALLALLLLPGAALANHEGENTWRVDRVVVEDHTDPGTHDLIRESVRDWNAALPDTIKLVYREADRDRHCDLHLDQYDKGTIGICNDSDDHGCGCSGMTYPWTDGRKILRAAVFLVMGNDVPVGNEFGESLACHELGHALGLDHGLHTCVGEWRMNPTAHDAEALTRMYGG